jgi:hypothetical protein
MWTRRAQHLTVIALGAATSLLLGSGVLSRVSDSASSPDNRVHSAPFSAVSHDIRIAENHTTGLDSCPQMYGAGLGEDGAPRPEWVDEIGAQFSDPVISLEESQGPLSAATRVCVANFGSQRMDVDLVFPEATIVSAESSCEAAEAASPSDRCDEANQGSDPGELSSALQVQVIDTGTGEPLLDGRFSDVVQGRHVMSLDPGVPRSVLLLIGHAPGLSDDEKAVAQTDSLKWDIVFSGHDPDSAISTGP